MKMKLVCSLFLCHACHENEILFLLYWAMPPNRTFGRLFEHHQISKKCTNVSMCQYIIILWNGDGYDSITSVDLLLVGCFFLVAYLASACRRHCLFYVGRMVVQMPLRLQVAAMAIKLHLQQSFG